MQTLDAMTGQRAMKGYALVANGSVAQLDTNTFLVPSQSKNLKYQVYRTGNDWSCECSDYQFRPVICKHIYAVRLWIQLKEQLQPKTVKVTYPEIYACKF